MVGLSRSRTFIRRRVDAKPEHIREITLKGAIHNNKLERMNGEVRDREKVVRGLKREDSPVLKGYQLYHNYFRPHMGLNGKTPAEAAGITIEGENKWETVIKNAACGHLPSLDSANKQERLP